MGGIQPPSVGTVSKNRSTRRKTTERSKKVGPLRPKGARLLGSHSEAPHSDTFLLVFVHFNLHNFDM